VIGVARSLGSVISVLEDGDVVVRGGIFSDPDLILEVVEDAIDMGYGPVLSVFVGKIAAHDNVESSVRAACVDGSIPHGKVRFCHARELIDAGFELVHDTSAGQPECHFHVLFPEEPTSVDADRFIRCFGEPIKNPAKGSAT
jgi:hypothetical protein